MRHDIKKIFMFLCLVLPSIVGCSIGGKYGYSQSVGSDQSLPEFPEGWPPPGWSSSYVLQESMFANASTVGQAMKMIAAALDRNGYFDKSFYKTRDGGVVLVTRLERIQDDGSPSPDDKRWAGQDSSQDLRRMFYNAYFTEQGHYRVILFVLGGSFGQSGRAPTREEAKDWLGKGITALPHEVAELPLGTANCTVLVYEFESNGSAATLVTDGALPAGLQLKRSGILASLSQVH